MKVSYIYFFCGFLIIFALTLFNLAVYLFKNNPQVLSASDEVPKEIIFWQNFLVQNPNYKSGWLELAKLEYEGGDTSQALVALEEVEKIDPNSEELNTLRKRVELGL